MTKKKYEEEDGVWRTVGGRRIFIADGEDLATAMKRSGKFERKQKIQKNEVDDINYLSKLKKEGKIDKEKYENLKKETKDFYQERLKGKDSIIDIPEAYRQYEKDYENEMMANEYFGSGHKLPNEKDYLQGGKKWNNEWESSRETKLNKEQLNNIKGINSQEMDKVSEDNFKRDRLKYVEENDKKMIDTYNKAKKLGMSEEEATKVALKERQKTGNDYLPKESKITTQGTSNRKEVSDNIQAHILSYYDNPVDFMEQMDNMDYLPTRWRAGEEMAKGGNYLIYNGDMQDYLGTLGINPKGKKFSDDRAFQTYTSLVGRESERLYTKIEKLFEQYKKEHKNSNATLDDFRKWFK